MLDQLNEYFGHFRNHESPASLTRQQVLRVLQHLEKVHAALLHVKLGERGSRQILVVDQVEVLSV
jgi:hypothetical protein